MASDLRGRDKASILRVRAGFLLVLALVIFCISAGRYLTVTFGLGWGWGLVLVLAFSALVAWGLTRLTRKVYFIVATAVTLLTFYLAYDFLLGAVGFSSTTSLLIAVVPLALVAAAFWDFRVLREEVTRWLNSR